jgi:hypothetical protein
LKTFALPVVTIGDATYGEVSSTEYLDHVYNYAYYGSQGHKSGIEPIARWVQGDSKPTYHAILFYDGDNASPEAFTNFTDVMIPVESTFQVRPSMYNWTQEADPDQLDLRGLRARFNVVSIKADRQTLQTIHDTYFDMVQSELNTVSIAVASIVFIPIIDSYITASTVNGGNPMPVDAAQAPYIWAQETLLWSDAAEDANITDFLSAFNANITWQLSSLGGVFVPFPLSQLFR